MKLLIIFVQKENASDLITKLRDQNIAVTVMDSEGGFLRRQNKTLLLALQDDLVSTAVEIIKETCRVRTEKVDTAFASGSIESVGLPAQAEIPVGGATILIMNIESIEKT